MRYKGRCHCGAIGFEVELDLRLGVTQCNCSICIRRGARTVVVAPANFVLSSGEDAISEYQPGEGRYAFCRHCGIHVFGRGDLEFLGGPFVAVNINCLDGLDLAGVVLRHVDGKRDTWLPLREEVLSSD